MQITKDNEEDDYISEKILNIIVQMEDYTDVTNYVVELLEISKYETSYIQTYLKIINDYIKPFNTSNNFSQRIYVINKLYQLLYPNSESTDQTQVIPFNSQHFSN